MKKIINILITLIILAILYYAYDRLFEIFPDRAIVIGFLVFVALIILYFSLRPCFAKERKEKINGNTEERD